MEQNNMVVIKNSFFNSYKSFIDYITVTHTNFSMYSILVFKKKTYNNLVKVNIIIRNFQNEENTINEFSSSVTLNNIEAEGLIDDIRKDFKDNHDIEYTSINYRTCFQTIQNTKFSLNIKLNDDRELEKAFYFNEDINRNEKRYKVKVR